MKLLDVSATKIKSTLRSFVSSQQQTLPR